jgi:peptidase E
VSARRIVALGGGGFSEAPGVVTALDRYILSLAAIEDPRVLFVPTASGDAAPYVERFYAAFSQVRCRPSHLSLFGPPYPSLPEKVLDQYRVEPGDDGVRETRIEPDLLDG